jgi:homogentisate phytyltransferase/homogentisate geranylgeranyltransferase
MIDGLKHEVADYASDGFFRQLWRFSRPHTIVGTTLSLVFLWLMAKGLFPENTVFGNASNALGIPKVIGWQTLIFTWVACIAANVYIVGLNQVTDVPLDKINKPYLPLASGAWPMRLGTLVIWTCLLISLVSTAWVASTFLWWTVGLSIALGTAYSLPPIRLKRFPFWAAFCIIAVRSLIVNLLLFAHVAGWSSDVRDMQPYVWLLVTVMFAFSIAIAWFKDLPDLIGDEANGINTLAIELGSNKVLFYGSAVMVATLGASIAAGWFFFDNLYLVVGQSIMLALFILLMLRVDLQDRVSIRRFYLGLWALFFLEYGVFAGVAWLG